MWFVFLPMAPLSSAAAVIPGLAAVTVALALLSSVLLSHLLCFHVYLSKTRSPVHPFTRSPSGCVSRVCVQCGTGSAPTSTSSASATVRAEETAGNRQQVRRWTSPR